VAEQPKLEQPGGSINIDTCCVCDRPLDANRAACNECGREFHLALRTDIAVQDCGDAWIHDELQAVVFGCDDCLGRTRSAAARHRYARRAGSAVDIARARRRGLSQNSTRSGESDAPRSPT
jgi:predicted amidophosphoribosyltransferase